jgi:alanine racemase
MASRVNLGTLRRELRISRSAVESNLDSLGLKFDEIKPLASAAVDPEGLLGLYGSELLLLEKVLGITAGVPAVRLVGELVLVKQVPAETGISYGYLSKTRATTNLGLVGIGFSDGLPRSSSNCFTVTIEGKTYPGVGRMAMDQCVIDLGTDSPALGSEVHFFTTDYSLSDFSAASGFSPLEIFGRITARVSRTWSA